MTCDQVRHNLSAYVDDDLPLPRRSRVEAHLAGCAACRAELRRWQETARVLAGLWPLAPSPNLLPRFHAALAARQRTAPRARRPPAWGLASLVLVGVLSVLCLSQRVAPPLALPKLQSAECKAQSGRVQDRSCPVEIAKGWTSQLVGGSWAVSGPEQVRASSHAFSCNTRENKAYPVIASVAKQFPGARTRPRGRLLRRSAPRNDIVMLRGAPGRVNKARSPLTTRRDRAVPRAARLAAAPTMRMEPTEAVPEPAALGDQGVPPDQELPARITPGDQGVSPDPEPAEAEPPSETGSYIVIVVHPPPEPLPEGVERIWVDGWQVTYLPPPARYYAEVRDPAAGEVRVQRVEETIEAETLRPRLNLEIAVRTDESPSAS